MKPFDRWGFTVLAVVVAVTGLVYLYMNEFMTTDDPFALVNHPWQIPMLVAHIVAAPVFIALFGMLLATHSLPKLHAHDVAGQREASPHVHTNELSGHFALWSSVVTILSAYFHQVSTTPVLVNIWWWTHILAGTAFVAGYATHFVVGLQVGRLRWRFRRLAGTSTEAKMADGPAGERT